MGKGKGMFDRWMFKIQRGFILAEFLGISFYKLSHSINWLNKKLKLKLKIICSKKITFLKNWTNSNSVFFFNKYRYL
jgi:ribosomal protein L16/L10AE